MSRDLEPADDLFTTRVALGLRELDGREQAPDVSTLVAQRLALDAPGAGHARVNSVALLAALLALAVTAALWLQNQGGASAEGAAPTAPQDPKATEGGGGAASGPQVLRPTDVDLGHGYVRRDGAIHFLGGGRTGKGVDATRIDRPSSEVLAGFRRVVLGAVESCEGLDVDAFVALSEEYVRDDARVYHKVISPGVFLVMQLHDADPASFEVLARNLARDQGHVWFYDRIQRGVDPATVVLVDDGRVFKDHDSVHYAYDEIAGADPASFRHLGSGYYADRHRVYWCTEPVPGADLATFEVLGGSFVAKDRSRVYRSGEYLAHYDAGSLQLILHHAMGFQILADKNGIHVNKQTFPRAKPGRVEVIDEFTVRTGDLVLLVETSRCNPVTVYRQDGKLMAATPAYDATSGETLGTIIAEVTPAGLVGIRIEPLEASRKAPAVPSWQIDVLRNPELVKRMVDAAQLLR